MSFVSRLSSNAWQIILGTAFTSVGFHLLFARRQAAADHARYTARITILEDLVAKMKTGEYVPADEINRLLQLGRKAQETEEIDIAREPTETISWKEVFFGK